MIAKATTEDLERMEPTARKFYNSSRFLRVFEASRFIALWSSLFSAGTGVIFVVRENDQIVGAIGGVVYPEPYSGDLIAQEFFWFVEPEYRGVGMRLYFTFEGWARDRGCEEIRMGHLHDLMPDKIAAVYRRLGFSAVETNYSKRLTKVERQLAG